MKRDHSDKAFQAFIEKLPAVDGAPNTPAPNELDDPIVHELVVACLAWDAPRSGVAPALDRVRSTLIDFNEFRVMIPEDAGGLLGPRYPKAEERCARIRAALTEVFLRENGLALAHLRDASKRDAKAYLESLPGLPAYAANRVALVGCGVHTFPVDSLIFDLFEHAGVIEESFSQAQLSSRLERAVRAADAMDRYRSIEAAAAKPQRKAPSGSARKTTKKAPAKPRKKTTKKSSGKTTKKTASGADKKTSRKKTGKSA